MFGAQIPKSDVFMEAYMLAFVEGAGIRTSRVRRVALEEGYWVMEMSKVYASRTFRKAVCWRFYRRSDGRREDGGYTRRNKQGRRHGPSVVQGPRRARHLAESGAYQEAKRKAARLAQGTSRRERHLPRGYPSEQYISIRTIYLFPPTGCGRQSTGRRSQRAALAPMRAARM